MRTRILLADDHAIVREGLRSLLEKEEELEAAGEADSGRAATEMARDLKPDVVALGLRTTASSALDAQRRGRGIQ